MVRVIAVLGLLDGAHVGIPGVIDEDINSTKGGKGLSRVLAHVGLWQREVELQDPDAVDFETVGHLCGAPHGGDDAVAFLGGFKGELEARNRCWRR